MIKAHKGQVISKGFFAVFNFFKKANKNTSHGSKKQIHLFAIWNNSWHDNLL